MLFVGTAFALTCRANPPAEERALPLVEDSEKRYDGLTLARWRERIKTLEYQDSASTTAVPGLMEIVRDRSAPWVSRRQAAETLGRLGPYGVSALPALLDLLNEPADGESDPATWGLKAIALSGPSAREAAPALARLVGDRDANLLHRELALEALAQIGPTHAVVLPAILDLLDLSKSAKGVAEDSTAWADALELRELAVETFTLLGPRGAPAVPALLRLTREPSDLLRMKTAQAFGAMGGQANLAIPALAEMLLFDDSPIARDAAGEALARIGVEAVPVLVQLLDDVEVEVRTRAATALGTMGRPARAAVEPLSKRLKDESAAVRILAAQSIWQITRESDGIVPTVVRGLTEEDRQLRIRAFRLLSQMGSKGESARPLLQELQSDDRAYVRDAARKALQRLDDGKGL